MFQFRSNGLAKSRLDCFLISREWYDSWEDSSQHVLVRNISDHCLILLKVTSINWGPFRVLNYWCKEKSFIKLVHEEWNAIEVKGCGAYVLKEKIKKLKEKIKEWNEREFGNVDRRLKNVMHKLNLMAKKDEEIGLGTKDIKKKKELQEEFWKAAKQNE